jgi:hypothetical protein
MKQDRFLIGILAAIAVLIVFSLVLFFTRTSPPSYLPETTPENIVHNYVLALQENNFERAQGYLVEAEGKPSVGEFAAVLTNFNRYEDVGAQILSSQEFNQEAFVEMDLIHRSNGLFDNGWTERVTASLIKQDGQWKITAMPYPYWDFSWYDGKPIKVPPAP